MAHGTVWEQTSGNHRRLPHTIDPARLTGLFAPRYVVGMKEQWKQGLQWGGVVWLSWLSVSSVAWVIATAHFGLHPPSLILAAGWTFALALSWTRWARFGVAMGMVAQVYAGVILGKPIIGRADMIMNGTMTQSYLDLAPFLTAFLPSCLPLVPLLFMAPERPRYTAALALVGRYRDAAHELSGVRWMLVAAGVIALHIVLPEAVRWWTIDEEGRVCFWWTHVGGALAPCATLFGLAAIRQPRDRVAT